MKTSIVVEQADDYLPIGIFLGDVVREEPSYWTIPVLFIVHCSKDLALDLDGPHNFGNSLPFWNKTVNFLHE